METYPHDDRAYLNMDQRMERFFQAMDSVYFNVHWYNQNLHLLLNYSVSEVKERAEISIYALVRQAFTWLYTLEHAPHPTIWFSWQDEENKPWLSIRPVDLQTKRAFAAYEEYLLAKELAKP